MGAIPLREFLLKVLPSEGMDRLLQETPVTLQTASGLYLPKDTSCPVTVMASEGATS